MQPQQRPRRRSNGRLRTPLGRNRHRGRRLRGLRRLV
ncbi:MAG: 50S ribosomal protein L34 [Tannerella sp.]|nr:MAG: 50S ribosomal protein L34 [Tannerella sp.]